MVLSAARDALAEERDQAAAQRDLVDADRDETARLRDECAFDRDLREVGQEEALRLMIARTQVRRQAQGGRRELESVAVDLDARFQQAQVDREAARSEVEMLEDDLLALLDAARRQRWAAAEDRSASKLDRSNAVLGRQAASRDRYAAADDRSAAAADRDQHAISRNLAADPSRDTGCQ